MSLTDAKKVLIQQLNSIPDLKEICDNGQIITFLKNNLVIKITLLPEDCIASFNSKKMPKSPFARFEEKTFYFEQKIEYAGYIESEQGCIDILFWENNWSTVQLTEDPGKCYFKIGYLGLTHYDVLGAKYINKKSLTDYLSQL